ncbi:MAG: hypothetical protein ABI760_11065 [Ferruginibacter sp.]
MLKIGDDQDIKEAETGYREAVPGWGKDENNYKVLEQQIASILFMND